jgi:hypothetical protein
LKLSLDPEPDWWAKAQREFQAAGQGILPMPHGTTTLSHWVQSNAAPTSTPHGPQQQTWRTVGLRGPAVIVGGGASATTSSTVHRRASAAPVRGGPRTTAAPRRGQTAQPQSRLMHAGASFKAAANSRQRQQQACMVQLGSKAANSTAPHSDIWPSGAVAPMPTLNGSINPTKVVYGVPGGSANQMRPLSGQYPAQPQTVGVVQHQLGGLGFTETQPQPG